MTDWEQVAERDRSLRNKAENASEALAQHRYDNTIAAEISFSEYARQCSLNESTVRRYVKALEIRHGTPNLTMSDALILAATTRERGEAIQAVAADRGIPASSAAKLTNEVDQVLRERQGRPRLQFVELESRILGVRRTLRKLGDAEDMELDEEARALLRASINVARSLLALVELKYVDAIQVDWDAELVKLGED